jgi:hypothetical protein
MGRMIDAGIALRQTLDRYVESGDRFHTLPRPLRNRSGNRPYRGSVIRHLTPDTRIPTPDTRGPATRGQGGRAAVELLRRPAYHDVVEEAW